MTYDFSLDKKKAILLAVVSMVLLALTFFAGLFLGVMMRLPETVTVAANSEKPEKAAAGAPVKLLLKLPAQPEVKLPPTPEVKLPPTPEVKLPPTPEVKLPPTPEVKLPPTPEVKLPPKPEVKLPKIVNKLAPVVPAAVPQTPAAVPATPTVAPATPSPVPTAVKPKPVEPYLYSIRIASYNKEEDASKALIQEQKAGLPLYLAKVYLGSKGVWWRLFAGYYYDREAAMAAVAEHNLKDAQIVKTPYANLIGTFSSEAEMADLFKRLDAKGYSPYVIKDADDRFRLITGAFITKKGAQDQQRDLKADGFDSKIVER